MIKIKIPILVPLFLQFADIDECATKSPCDGICRNTIGSFECQCAYGFQLDEEDKCVDIDECLDDPCQGICINTQGSYSCSCELGYQLGDNGTCSGNLAPLKNTNEYWHDNFIYSKTLTNAFPTLALLSVLMRRDLTAACVRLVISLKTTYVKVS